MKLKEKKYDSLLERINSILETAEQMERKYKPQLDLVHNAYKKSAVNLVHYMALRSHYISDMQRELRFLGLPGLDNVEGHVMRSLLVLKTILNHLVGEAKYEHRKGTISIKRSVKLLNANTKALFGYKSKKRRTRIMVTLPNTAAEDKVFVNDLVGLGMNSARVNCAHDKPEVWTKMISNVKEAAVRKGRKVKVMMDLGGPKLRTGAMVHGPQVIHIRPEKDAVGRITNPAKIWLAPADVPPPSEDAQAIILIEEEWMMLMKSGDELNFKDSRGKNRSIKVLEREGKGRWALCNSSAYITPETEFELKKQKGKIDRIEIGELQAFEQSITLSTGDMLYIHKDPKPGEPAMFDEDGSLLMPAHISCTLPEVFDDVKVGEPIMFDDGKVEGIIEQAGKEELRVKILHAKKNGSKLRSYKGINLPESNLRISGLTEKDKMDLNFVAVHADVVNLSFVNTPDDVRQLTDMLDKLGSNIGIILKIETRKGFDNLPGILLEAMKSYPVGVMIARGDLAVETGWKQIATIQEEILRICEAAHIPDIWATQVLENLAKKGTPSRAEITDAAASQRAECVMLNKGVYIRKAVRLLDRILRQMQSYQDKKETVLSKIDDAGELSLKRDYS